MEQWWNGDERGETEELGEKPAPVSHVHHESHLIGCNYVSSADGAVPRGYSIDGIHRGATRSAITFLLPEGVKTVENRGRFVMVITVCAILKFTNGWNASEEGTQCC
jgi:hypothetical protein